MDKWKPTREEAAMIRRFARAESTERLVKIEVAIRCNIKDQEIPHSINIAMVTLDGFDSDWNDTDLADYADWSEFRSGVELTPDGKAIVDFYLQGREWLGGNLTLYYSEGSIERIHGYGGNGSWYTRG